MAIVKEMKQKRPGKRKTPGRHTASQDDYEFPLPEFATAAEREAWWASLPKVELEFDPRLEIREEVTLRLNRREVEAFDFLSQEAGVGDGKTLMYIVLKLYLTENLPKEF